MSTCSHDIPDDEDPGTCSIAVIDSSAVEAARHSAPDDRVVAVTADIFSALSDPTRLRILSALAMGELCVCDLAAISGVSSSAVSHQLRLLRDRGLVSFDRVGRRAIYRLADDHVRTLLEQGIEHARERA